MLIGVNGQVAAGKDSVFARAKFLVSKLPEFSHFPKPERIAFADKLKLAAARALGVSVEMLEEHKRSDTSRITLTAQYETLEANENVPEGTKFWANEAKISVRQYLQYFGTEVGRETFGENFWVDQSLPSDFDHAGRLIFVTDCRFDNEVERVHSLGGIVCRVLNGPLIDGGHASENILDSDLIDIEIDNSIRDDGYLSLDGQVTNLLRSLTTVSA